ncbi:hepatocyte growth factor-regulated tyrosine kinase substrate isoform X2 [Dermacentor silvarum]|uniref:hepatocyte growth factor-regulated tyrosine kinase substrate isoform X2 n=1 Tax=Dermacentor silvarum TaxID=543639 RepID=UPI00189B62A4|nr:hepatocyte growth factor-regulated tyrosine kinase substrate isoform X2 [Dermacentor silvarum]
MNTAVIMRNSKVRTFLYVLLGCCMLFTVFLLSSTHTKLKDSQESNDKCQQQRDSLSAQLQVVYEHKSRLEKTLQLETTDRKKAEDAAKTLRDQAERDRADARDKIKSLQKDLTEFQASQTEEFKNLKASFDTLHQEKEKVDNELANHVALLQQERDSKTKLARQLEELLQSRKTEGQLDLMLQRQLETCRAETSQLYAKLQQQNLAQSQHLAVSGGHDKPVANNADLLAGNGAAHAAAPPPSLAQGGTEAKASAKEDKGAGKMGPPYQVSGAESWPPKVIVGGEASDSLKPIARNARNPAPAEQVLGPPNELALQQSGKGSPTVPHNEGRLSPAPGKSAAHAMPLLLQPEDKLNRDNSERFAQPQNQVQPVGQKPMVVSQPGVPQVSLQPVSQAEPSQQPPAQPLARPVAQPAVQVEPQSMHKPPKQLAQQLGLNPGALPQAKGQLAQANLGQYAALEQGHKPLDAASLPMVGRLPKPAGQPAIAGHSQELQESVVKPAQQPPMQLQPAVGNQAPPVLPAPSIAKSQPPAAGVDAKNHGLAQPAQPMDDLGGLLDNVAGLEKIPIGDGAVPAKAGSSRAGVVGAAVKKSMDLEEGNELEGGANYKVLLNKVPNNGDDLLIGHGGKALGPKLARPNQHQQLAAGGIGGGEDDLDYANAVVKDDDAAEDQEDDGPFGADLGRGKPMPDAADFDDQGAEADPLQQQQPNNIPEDGIAANPK